MPYGISIKCLNSTASPILELWDEASVFEPVASMKRLNYPPHLTLAVFQNDPGPMTEILEEVFISQPKLTIPFESISYFDNDHLVLWAKPRHDEALLDLHAKLHGHFDPAICDEYYRAGRWTPHCSLATNVPTSKAQAAIEWANKKRPEFSVEFDTADFVQFPPVAVRQEHRLR